MSESTYSKEIHVEGIPIDSLCAKEYEDPRDATYLNALKLNKSFDKIVKLAIEYGIERANKIIYTGSNVRVTEKNMPYLYNCVKNACEILGVNEIPDTYIIQDPYLNACTIGAQHPILVLNDSIIKRLNHEELMFIIGHEVGHIKSEHCQYHMLGSYLQLLLSYGIDAIPFVGPLVKLVLSTGLDIAYYDWSRKSEFTADHAGLLTCQDLNAAISALAKIGGYPQEFYDYFDIDSFIEQAKEFDDLDESSYNKVVKLFYTINNTHPWTVQRAKELLLWVESGSYAKIILRSSDWLKNEALRLENCASSQAYYQQQPQQGYQQPPQQDYQQQPQQDYRQQQPQQGYQQPQSEFSSIENTAKSLFAKGKNFAQKLGNSSQSQQQYYQNPPAQNPQYAPRQPAPAQEPAPVQAPAPVQENIDYRKIYKEATQEQINEITDKILGNITRI